MPPAWTQAGERELGAAISEGGGSSRANLRIGTAALVAVKVARGPVGCGSSLTDCGRRAGPRLPCPPTGSTSPLARDNTAPGPSSLAQRQPPLPHRVDLSQPRAVPARSRPTRHSRPSAAHRRRPASQVQPLDDRHGIAPILCRRTLRPRHDAFSIPSSAIARCPRCFSKWSRSSPRRAYPTHGGPAEQSTRRSRSIASVMASPQSCMSIPPCPTPD